jgi:lipopolysaccharide transport system permease protein
MPSDGIPYPIFNFSALVAWTYFASAISAAGNSLIGNAGLISKIYFPRLIIPLTPVLAGLLDFAIALVFLIGMMIYYNTYPTAMIFALPLLILLMMLTATGVGAMLAALNAKYRDVRYAIPFLIQLWMFASPIVYPASLVPGKYRILYALNPMTGVIEGFRSALLGGTMFPTDMVLIAAVVSILIFILGIAYFRQTESDFADII